MRARVLQSILKRLDKLDAPLRAERNRAAYVIALHGGVASDETRRQFTRAQRTILAWPPILSWEEWEKLAAASQDLLMQSSAEDRAVRVEPAVTVSEPDPSIESETDYRDKHKQAVLGGLDYVRDKERRLRDVVR